MELLGASHLDALTDRGLEGAAALFALPGDTREPFSGKLRKFKKIHSHPKSLQHSHNLRSISARFDVNKNLGENNRGKAGGEA